MADLSKYFVGQQNTGLQPLNTGVQTSGLEPLSRQQNIQSLQEAADKAKSESDRINSPLSQAGMIGGGIVGGLANAFLKQPARFVASSAAAPIDLANQVQGKQPFTGEIPLLGRTFQGQAAVDQNRLFDKAYSGEKFTAGDYGTALRPFGEVPLAALETVSLAKGIGEARQVMKKSADKAKNAYLTDLLTPPKSSAKTSGFVKAVKSGRVNEAGVFKGRSVTPDKRTLDLVEELKTVPGIRKGQTALQTGNATWGEIGNTAEELRAKLRSMDVQPTVGAEDLNRLFEDAQAQVSKNPFLTGDANKTVGDIFNEFVSRLPKDRPITAEDVLDARQGVDGWIESQRGATVFDPAKENAVSVGLRAIRQGANGLLAEKAPDVEVARSLLRQTRLYDALERIALKAAKENGKSVAEKTLGPALRWLGRGVGTLAPLGAGYYYAQAQKALGE